MSHTGPVYKLDSGWWLSPNDAARVAQALAAEIGVEKVTFDSLDMLWDPRKQIGDTVTLQAQDADGTTWEADCIITGYREAWAGKVPTVGYDLDVKQLRDVRASHRTTRLRIASLTRSCRSCRPASPRARRFSPCMRATAHGAFRLGSVNPSQ